MSWLRFWKKLSSVKVLWHVAGVCYIDTYFIALILMGALVSLKNYLKNHTWGFEHHCSTLPFRLCQACLLASRVFVGRLVLTRTFEELSVQNFLSTWAPTLPTWVLPCRTPRFWLQFLGWELMNFKTDIKLCLIWRHGFYPIALERQLYARC